MRYFKRRFAGFDTTIGSRDSRGQVRSPSPPPPLGGRGYRRSTDGAGLKTSSTPLKTQGQKNHVQYRCVTVCPWLYINGRVQWCKFVMDETRSVESMTNFRIGRVHELIYRAAQQLNYLFRGVFSRVNSPFIQFYIDKLWSHWTVHDDFVGSMTRFDHRQFQMNTCLYGTWSFSCMIKRCLGAAYNIIELRRYKTPKAQRPV